jgi:hypothetical protein
LGIIEEVEGRERHALVFRRPANMKIPFTPVQPRKRFASAVELGELQLVGSGDEIAAGFLFIIVALTTMPQGGGRFTPGVLCVVST